MRRYATAKPITEVVPVNGLKFMYLSKKSRAPGGSGLTTVESCRSVCFQLGQRDQCLPEGQSAIVGGDEARPADAHPGKP